MNNSREAQKREDMLLELYKFHAYIPNDAMGDPLTPFGNFCEGWQAATEQSQKEVAEKDARIAELERNVEKLTNANETWLEWRDEQVKQLDVLQAREKVLVEALEHYEPVISAIDNSKGFVARQALANVNNEKKG